MKQGDTVPVTIAGQTVAQASVKELGEGTVTLIVPATMVVMEVSTQIAPPTAAPVESDVVIIGVEDGKVESGTISAENIGATDEISGDEVKEVEGTQTLETQDTGGEEAAPEVTDESNTDS
jgi:hypothetical protein